MGGEDGHIQAGDKRRDPVVSLIVSLAHGIVHFRKLVPKSIGQRDNEFILHHRTATSCPNTHRHGEMRMMMVQCMSLGDDDIRGGGCPCCC